MSSLLLILRNYLAKIEAFFCGFLLVLMTGVISYGMFERFVIRHGVGWTDELSRYLSIWAIFFGASLGITRGAHIGVEVFVRLLPQKLQLFVQKFTFFVCALFTGILSYYSVLYFIRLLNSRQVTPGLQVPLCWAFLAVPIGLFLMCLHFFIQLWMPEEK